MGKIFNIQRFSIHDGPGIRTTVFFQGCNLRCSWCHNPESNSLGPVVQFFPEKCILCLRCVEVCPAGAQLVDGTARIYRRDLCQVCGACVQECFARALVMPAREASPQEVMEEVLKDRDYYVDSGGGVTFSGGEPFLQKDFLLELLRLGRVAGLHTAVDTAGNVPFEWLEEALPLTDLFLYDCKMIDPERHRQATGVDNRRILANLRRLGDGRTRVWVRAPVIPGVNDRPEDIAALGAFLADLRGIEWVELLPFHHLGSGKYESLGRDYPSRAVAPPKEMEMKAMLEQLTTYKLNARKMV